MADMRTWSHDFIEEFTQLYRSLPCWYDIKSKQYLNKPLKLDAYNKLVEKLKTVDPVARKDMVVKKINNMRKAVAPAERFMKLHYGIFIFWTSYTIMKYREKARLIWKLWKLTVKMMR